MDLNSTAEMLELAAKKLRETHRMSVYWMEYAFRLEEEIGATKCRPEPERDKNVTKSF